jgi:hypothetical protein
MEWNDGKWGKKDGGKKRRTMNTYFLFAFSSLNFVL